MSDKNQAPATGSSPEFLQYGGQAVIEGVMMRSPRYFAVACRKPDGTIVTQCEPVDKGIIGKLKWLNKPFLRGTLALVDAMALGTRAMSFAASMQIEAEQEMQARAQAELEGESARTPSDTKEHLDLIATEASIVNGPPVIISSEMPKSGKINDIAIGSTIVFAFVFGIALFVLLPTTITGFGQKWGLISKNSTFLANVIDGLIRMAFFFGYIGLISMMSQIRAVFQYHGAEHKSINTLEAGLPLTTANAMQASRLHPRCGTSFIFIVLVINMILLAFLPRPPLLLRWAMHLAVIPLVAGISYEVIKFAGRFRRNFLVAAVFAPGMWSQYLTTREPNEAQTEVALASLRAVLEAEGHVVSQTGQVAALTVSEPVPQEAVTA